jgi:hypothetical protein
MILNLCFSSFPSSQGLWLFVYHFPICFSLGLPHVAFMEESRFTTFHAIYEDECVIIDHLFHVY